MEPHFRDSGIPESAKSEAVEVNAQTASSSISARLDTEIYQNCNKTAPFDPARLGKERSPMDFFKILNIAGTILAWVIVLAGDLGRCARHRKTLRRCPIDPQLRELARWQWPASIPRKTRRSADFCRFNQKYENRKENMIGNITLYSRQGSSDKVYRQGLSPRTNVSQSRSPMGGGGLRRRHETGASLCRLASTVARVALRGSGWMLIRSGRLLQMGGKTLDAVGKTIRAKSKTGQSGQR